MKVTKMLYAGALVLLFLAATVSAQDFSPTLGMELSTYNVGETAEIYYTHEQDYGELDCDSTYTVINLGTVDYDAMSPLDIVGGGTALMAGEMYDLEFDLVVFSVNPAEPRATIQGVVTASNNPELPVGSVLYHMEVEGNYEDILITEWADTSDGNNWTMGVSIEIDYDGLLTLPQATAIMFSCTCVSEPDNSEIRHYYEEDFEMTLGVKGIPEVTPLAYSLAQNYPNPFNSSTMISYQVPVTSQVVLNIYNTEGRLVRTLVNDQVSQGSHHITWDGLSNTGNAVSTGVYLYRLQAGEFNSIQKMIYLK